MRLLYILPMAAIFLIAGCNRELDCQLRKDYGHFYFEGFDSASLERVVISRYDGYNRKTDSTIYLLSTLLIPLSFDNSGFVRWPYEFRIMVGEDLEVRVPAAG